ncbi:MAG: translation initiation factor IF-2 [Flavobacteriales bacterium]|jgi:translation initiation factor IF-2
MSKVTRLSKVAREFNVGVSTIVEFLHSKDKEVENSPNTKIDSEMYDFIAAEFQAEKSVREKIEEVREEQLEKKAAQLEKPEVIVETVVVEETPAPEPIPEVIPEPEVVLEEVVEEIKEEAPVNEETPPVIETPVKEEVPVAETKKETPVVETKETVKKEKPVKKEKLTVPSVVGKIELPVDKRKKAAQDKKDAIAKAKADKIAAEAKRKADKEAKDNPTPKVEKVEEKVEIETIKASAEKLSGVTVLRKIVLPVDKSKEKKAKAEAEAQERKKRKRIKKVNIEKAGKKATIEHRKAAPRKGAPRKEITPEDTKKQIQETLARLSSKGKNKSVKLRKDKRTQKAQEREAQEMMAEIEKGTLKLTEFVTVSELATMMDQSANAIIGTLMSIGIFASINQRLDAETLTMVAEEYGFEVDFVSADVTESIVVEEDKPEDMQDRPPIVTVMGHVDHGKTSLLDYIRSSKVTDGEAGGITQHIGAYSVTGESGRKITFLDTPGHEAFTAMRARGAQVTDIAIIIIAVDDDVMPQTKEAINHAQAAGVPMVFALNKMDKVGANPDKVREQLSQMNILLEEWGGKYQSQEISAKTGAGIEDLLEKVLLEAEVLELKANPDKNAIGTVIEATLDKGRGYVTTLLVESGTLKVGDTIVAGTQYGRVKIMHDEHGKIVEEAGPAKPVSILGMQGAANAGDTFNIISDEKEAKSIVTKRQQLQREQGLRTTKHITLDEIGRRLALGDFQELNLIIKGDVDGSIEALADSLLKLSTEGIQVNVIHKAVGQITESDVLLATASDAIIIGFQVRPSPSARKLAEKEEIDIRLYSIIYKAIEEIKEAMEGMLKPLTKEVIFGTAEIRDVFKITNVGTIAGCYVTEGTIARNNSVRVIRDGIVVYTGNLGSLKRFKDDVKEVKNNYECGLNIAKYNDIKVDDVVEAFGEIEIARKL